MKIIFNEPFDTKELVENFKKFCYEEHEKRIIKRGKLFSITASAEHISFGNMQVFTNKYDLMQKDFFNGRKIYDESIQAINDCLGILTEVCEEYGTKIKKESTGGIATEYVVYR